MNVLISVDLDPVRVVMNNLLVTGVVLEGKRLQGESIVYVPVIDLLLSLLLYSEAAVFILQVVLLFLSIILCSFYSTY